MTEGMAGPYSICGDPLYSRSAAGAFILVDKGGRELIAGKDNLRILLGSEHAVWIDGRGLAGVDPETWAGLFAGQDSPVFLKEESLSHSLPGSDARHLAVRIIGLADASQRRLVFIRDDTRQTEGRKRLSRALSLEAEASARLQAAVLVEGPRVESSSVDYACLTIPSAFVDGDFLDVFRLSEDSVEFILGDVMGKGMEAAILGSTIKFSLFRSLASSLYGSRSLASSAEICAMTEKAVSSILLASRSIATLVYGRFHEDTSAFEFVDCGHTAIVHYRKASGTLRRLKGADMPFGFMPSQWFRPFIVPCSPGDILLVFSDGLSECPGAELELFGEDRIMYALRSRAELAPEELAGSIVRLAFEYSQSGFTDDVSLICLKVKEEGFRNPVLCGERSWRVRPGSSGPTDELREALKKTLDRIPCLDEDEMSRLIQAAHEALSNILEHGLVPGSHECRCEWRILNGLLTIEFAYRGKDYDWLRKPAIDFSFETPRGYGLSIIHEVMDSVLLSEGFGDEKTLTLSRRLGCMKN